MVMEKVVVVNGSQSRQIYEKMMSPSESTSEKRKKRILEFENKFKKTRKETTK